MKPCVGRSSALINLCAYLLLVLLYGASPNLFATESTQPPSAAVASAHPWATEAGVAMLAQGGNAFDAAVAVAAMLAVVEPYSAGMGGGGFWLLHEAAKDRSVMVDAREKAPLAAHKDMYLDDSGKVNRDFSLNGPLAAGIPGQAAAFVHLVTHYGELPLKTTLAPAIKAARDGFPAFEHYIRLAGFRKDVLNRYPEAAGIFLKNGEPPKEGDLIKQPDLADTLQAIVDKGFDGFYKGEVAQKMVKSVTDAGGIWTLEDLKRYNIIERTPIVSTYHDFTITSVPPPSSGGVALATMFNILERFPWRTMNEVERTHLLVEAMKRAYKDRAEFLGDADFVEVPVERLTSKQHGEKWAKTIKLDKAVPSKELGKPLQHNEGYHTTHFSVLDREGNRVAATLSINLPFGSGFVAEGTGVLLNDEMDDFSAKPGVPNAYGLIGNLANAIAPGKRPLSSMSPSFIENEERVGILGTPGGSRIITMVMLGAVSMAEGEDPEQWVSRPRFHHQYLPDHIQHEPETFSEEMKTALEKKGHTLKSVGRQYGNMHGILWDKTAQEVKAASDPRVYGKAMLWSPTVAEKAVGE